MALLYAGLGAAAGSLFRNKSPGGRVSARDRAIASGMPGQVYDAGKDARQYYGEQMAALQTQASVLPRAVEIEESLRGGLQQSYGRGITSQAGTLLGVYESLRPITQNLQYQSIGQDISLYGMAGQMGTQAYLGSMDPRTRGIYGNLQNQALSDLRLGASLSPEDMQFAEQAGRAQFTASGFSGGRAAAIEALSGYNVSRQRLMERRNFGMQAYGLGEAATQAGYQFYANPAMSSSQMYSIPGLVASSEASLGALGPQFLTPESQYLANIRANRVQQENANRAAKAQERAGLASAAGSLAGAGIMALAMCWVARAVYGNDNPKWIVFRDWLLNEGPKWLLDIYLKHGESFAEYIKDKPYIKFVVRKAMDLVVDKKIKENETLLA
jgi:hypothetical protein